MLGVMGGGIGGVMGGGIWGAICCAGAGAMGPGGGPNCCCGTGAIVPDDANGG
ncbi:hypothetical protein GCM10009557_90810 [Virgisporangium ochraceum]